MYIVGLFYLALPTKIKINSDKEQSIRCFLQHLLILFPIEVPQSYMQQLYNTLLDDDDEPPIKCTKSVNVCINLFSVQLWGSADCSSESVNLLFRYMSCVIVLCRVGIIVTAKLLLYRSKFQKISFSHL